MVVRKVVVLNLGEILCTSGIINKGPVISSIFLKSNFCLNCGKNCRNEM